jgi:predicted TPR repeat methyltransferase
LPSPHSYRGRSTSTPEDPYDGIAPVYDAALGDRFFRGLRAAFEAIVRRYGIRFGSAADIGCGTGLFACYLSRKWRVPTYGVDRSRAMLAVAARSCRTCRVAFLHQDMRFLRLPCPVDLITANFDALNHVLTQADLADTLYGVAQNLAPGGHFIFDVLTDRQPARAVWTRRFELRGMILNQRIIWNSLRRTLVTRVALTQRGRPIAGRCVVERGHDLAALGCALHAAGLTLRAVLDATTLKTPRSYPTRAILVARKVLRPSRKCTKR